MKKFAKPLNYVKLKYKGLNLVRILNSLYPKYFIFNIKKNENEVQLSTSFFNEKKVVSYLKKNNYLLTERKERGILYFLKNIFLRLGIILGLSLIAIMIIVSNFFILKTKILGLEKLTSEQVSNFLSTIMNSYELKSNIDCKVIEKQLANNFEEISMVSVIKKGSTLVVSIKEKVFNDEFQNIDSFLPLTSSFSGKITNIELIQGTLAVQVGDMVKEGDILVFPYIIDSAGETRKVKAEANIYATVWFEETATHLENYFTAERTGKSVTENQLYLFDKLVVNNSKINYFILYEKSTKEQFLSNYLLPFIYKRITFYELEKIAHYEPIENVREKKFLELEHLCLKKTEKYEIINKYKNLSGGAGVYFLSVVYETNINIAKQIN